MTNKKILFSIEDGEVVEKTFYIICDKFVNIDEECVYAKDEINDYNIFESRNEAESHLLKPQLLPFEQKIKIIKELELESDIKWAFHCHYSTKTYKALKKLDISTELRYYLENKLNAYESELSDGTKAILSAFNVIF